MRATSPQTAPVSGGPNGPQPERLWRHYGFALMIVLCLIMATYVLNRAMVDRGLVAATAIMKSNAQIVIAGNIMSQAEAAIGAADPDLTAFTKSVTRFDTTYDSLLLVQGRSDDLSAHYFGGAVPLHLRISEFLALAQQFAAGPADQRAAILRRLDILYEDGRLRADLERAALLISRQVEADAVFFKRLQSMMMLASGLVLLGEALFIFLPAQRAVQSNLRAMQRTTSELRTSQDRLKQVNSKLEHTVRHDQLTALPNRRFLTEYLSEMIGTRGADDTCLFLVGLDDFKSVNDSIGPDYGDALLIAVSRALQNCVNYDEFVGRVGGDQFVLVSHEPAPFVIKRIMAALRDPFSIKGRRIPITASIGYLDINDRTRKPLSTLTDAETALQAAKSAGGNRAQPFTQNLRDDLSTMQQLQLELSDAIQNGELEPWFQPQVELAGGRLHGAEVLARWRHPTRGLLTPDKFLPAAERAGLIVELDHAIWRAAMELAQGWQADKLWRPMISLNAAPDTISDPYLLERFLLSLQRSGLEADQVIVEVLETTLINGKDDLAAINIDSLADCGIALELDDFGTGYASLSKLTQLPLAGIKLDRSLVAPLPDQAADSVVRAILALATELGLHVVAEGIEEKIQASHLSARGCRVGQGYGFGKPMPPDDFALWLHTYADVAVQPHLDMSGLSGTS